MNSSTVASVNRFCSARILNPMSVFVISVVGGWLGTGVFEPILKRLGYAGA